TRRDPATPRKHALQRIGRTPQRAAACSAQMRTSHAAAGCTPAACEAEVFEAEAADGEPATTVNDLSSMSASPAPPPPPEGEADNFLRRATGARARAAARFLRR